MCPSSTTKMRETGWRDTEVLFRVIFRARQKRWQRGTRAGSFAELQNTEELLEGSISLALTRELVNFAHGGVTNEDQARHLNARSTLAMRDPDVRCPLWLAVSSIKLLAKPRKRPKRRTRLSAQAAEIR
jgi:hypothetical protein